MISVAVCTHNRASSLERTLESLVDARVPEASWEILVVDNASTDDTRDVVRRFAASSASLAVRYVYEGRPGLCQARNAGIAAARGDVVAFLDDDVRVSENWAITLETAFAENGVDCVGGRAVLVAEAPRPRWWRESYDGQAGHFDRGDEPFLSESPDDGMIGIGANLSFRREAFDRYGRFRVDLDRVRNELWMGGDNEMVDRIRRSGGRALYLPDLVVYHHPAADRFTKSYLRRWFRAWGRWRFEVELSAPARIVRIGGVPRWRFRTALKDVLDWLGCRLRGRPADAFWAELRLRAFRGYLEAAKERGWRAEAGGTAPPISVDHHEGGRS